MKYSFRIVLFTLLLLAGSVILTACNDSGNEPDSVQRNKLVQDQIVPSNTFYTSGLSEITIQGKGFEAGDRLYLERDGVRTPLTILDMDYKYISFAIPADLVSGEYLLILERGDLSQELGRLTIRVSIDLNVPDRQGATIKGAVFCGRTPIAGAAVSDGRAVTVTDENGYYWLESEKPRGYVFVSTPEGYQPMNKGGVPLIWGMTTGAEVDQINFELVEADNSEHVMIVMTDAHIADYTQQDLAQYDNIFIEDLKSFVAESYPGRKVYAINTGDMTSDWLWYTNPVYTIADYAASLGGYDLPFMTYHCPGNHDNDPKVAGDQPSEAAYVSVLGPTYYSFNMGGIHYVMLDNVIFLNPNGSPGNVGDRTYREGFTDMQMEWLKADLALIPPTTPIHIGLHCPFFYYDPASPNPGGGMPATEKLKLLDCLSGFYKVHFMSGHTHNNVNMPESAINGIAVSEHNLVAASCDWWWSGYYTGSLSGTFNVNNAVSISMDGTPQAYAVYEISNGTVKNSYLKAVGKPANKQFFAFDMNAVRDFYITNPNNSVIKLYNYTNSVGESFASRRDDYADVEDNTVFINVWNWNPGWTISVTEGQSPLTVSKVSKPDPMHILCLEVAAMTVGGQISGTGVTNNSSHMFSVRANSATSTLTIKATDPYGNEYVEVMSRPKVFNRMME